MVKRVVAGLIFGEFGHRLPESYDINVFSREGLTDLKPSTQINLREELKLLLEQPLTYIGDESVFSFQRIYKKESYCSLWLLAFFKTTIFVAFVNPKNA